MLRREGEKKETRTTPKSLLIGTGIFFPFLINKTALQDTVNEKQIGSFFGETRFIYIPQTQYMKTELSE